MTTLQQKQLQLALQDLNDLQFNLEAILDTETEKRDNQLNQMALINQVESLRNDPDYKILDVNCIVLQEALDHIEEVINQLKIIEHKNKEG